MKTPVLIPAYNEEARIGAVLDSLPKDLVEPIIAVNGSTDATAEIAEARGAKVYTFAEQGMLPAIQGALRNMGDAALEPLFLLDADTRPIFPRSWHRIMRGAFHEDDRRPAYVTGPAVFTPIEGGSSVDPILRTIYRSTHGLITASHASPEKAPYYGPNQAFALHDKETLERVLSLDHFWFRGDVALAVAIAGKGRGDFTQILNPGAAAFTPESERFRPFSEWIIKGIRATERTTKQAYEDSAAEGSKSYED